MPPSGEVLEPAITSKSEARKLINQAVAHFNTAKRATIQVMADLRLLQDGDVHRLYGETNFSEWAAKTFDGLGEGNVRQLTRAGGIALELDRRKLIDLSKPVGVGTTALRELSVIANDYGDEKMVEIFRTAQEMVKDEGRDVSATTVKAAMQLLMPPAKPVLEEPEALESVEDENDDGEDEDERHPPKIRELIERIRDLSWDLPETSGEIREATEQLEAELANKSNKHDEKWIESKR